MVDSNKFRHAQVIQVKMASIKRGKSKKGFLRLSNEEVAVMEDGDYSGSEIELLDVSEMRGNGSLLKEPLEARLTHWPVPKWYHLEFVLQKNMNYNNKYL